MLVKDTKGRVLTDVHGRPMTTKDRWHPLVVSFVKRVIADGGEIISPAIEEMNQMAWAGKFEDALYVYFAGARKVGKTYALIGDDLTVERDSVAYEWEKYRTLDEIVNDMPEIAFDPASGVLRGITNRQQETNTIEDSENFDTSTTNWTIPPGRGTQCVFEENIKGIDMWNLYATEDGNAKAIIDTTAYRQEDSVFSFFAKDNGKRYVATPNTIGLVSTIGVGFDLQTGEVNVKENQGITAWTKDCGDGLWRCFVKWEATAGSSNFNRVQLFPVDSITDLDNESGRFFTSNGTDGVLIGGCTMTDGVSAYIETSGAMATRLGDDISGIPPNVTDCVIFADIFIEQNNEERTRRAFTLLEQSNKYFGIRISASGALGANYVNTSGSPVIVRTVEAFVEEGNHKIAAVIQQNSFKLYIDGAVIGENTTPFNLTVNPTELYIGMFYSINPQSFNNPVKMAAIYPSSISEERIIELTTL